MKHVWIQPTFEVNIEITQATQATCTGQTVTTRGIDQTAKLRQPGMVLVGCSGKTPV